MLSAAAAMLEQAAAAAAAGYVPAVPVELHTVAWLSLHAELSQLAADVLKLKPGASQQYLLRRRLQAELVGFGHHAMPVRWYIHGRTHTLQFPTHST